MRRQRTDWHDILRRALSDLKYSEKASSGEVFLISLKRTPLRKARTVQALEFQSVPYRIFDAVDGFDFLSGATLYKYAGRKKVHYLAPTTNWSKDYLLTLQHAHENGSLRDKFLKRSLHERLRFGCYMSHISVWQKIIDTDLPFAVILEDDVVLEKNFRYKLSLLLQNLPQSWGLLYLNGSFKRYGAKFRPGLVLSRGGVGAFAYVISSSAAHHFLTKAALKSDKAIDHVMDGEVLSGNVIAFHAQPPLVQLTENSPSTLAY